MRAAVTRFFAEFEPAFNAELALSNKAHFAFDECLMYVACFSMDSEGMTSAQVQKLFELMTACDEAKGATPDELKFTTNQALGRLESALRSNQPLERNR